MEADYPWSNQSNLVSSLDLLEEEVLRDASKHGLQWNQDKHLLVEGEPAATFPREITIIPPRKPQPVPKTARRRKSFVSSSRGDRSTNNTEEEEASRKQLQLDNERLQREISQWQREVEHARDEKLELESSFRRLDKEIGNGYHLAERKEKELRIAELVAKNQKMSQLLEKKLQGHEELRVKHAELRGEHKKLTDQVTLLNQVLNSVETKYTELSTSHNSLTASYEAAHHKIEALQRDNLVLQDKLSTSDAHVQIVNEYEGKIQQWERICRELEQKCEYKSNKLKQMQKIASATQQEAQRALDRQEELELELQAVHSQNIQINAALRAMEAKLEENMQTGSTQESLHRRIRQLEGELLHQNRANAELMQTCNQILSSQRRPGAVKTPRTARNDNVMASRVAKLTLTIISLTDKLRITEEARNRKNRSLDILMQAFPFLLRCLDATRDQLVAVVESNDIIKNALEQIHGPSLQNPIHVNEVPVSGPMYLRLARHKYLLEAPYPIELLADQTAAQVLNGNPESATALTRAKVKRFSPFRVTYSVLKGRDNQFEDENGDQMQLVLLSADSNDASGASYLNRSKINAFLEVIQSSAARKKFKTLVIGKLAEYMSKLRELAHRSASEAAVHQASFQMLQRELAELQQQLKTNEGANNDVVERGKSHKTHQFLLKMIDVYAEKQHENDHRQMTFLTQPLTSDILIINSQNEINAPPDDRLCLSNYELDDDDVAQLLLKIHVSGVRFREINLSSNNLSDVGAQCIADFIEKAPTSVRVVSLNGNKHISRCGVELIKRGLLRNQRVQRVKEDRECEDGVILRGLAIQQEFEVTGEGTDILCVILPIASENVGATVDLKTTTPEAVDGMVEKLRQLGFRYNIRPRSASSRLRPTSYNSKTRSEAQRTDVRPRSASAVPSSRKAPVPSSLGATTRRKSLPGNLTNANIRRQQIKQQQEQRFQSLEAAIRRASALSQRVQATRSSAPTHLNSRTARGSVNGNTVGTNRRSVGNTHINTIRRLRS